MSGTMSKHSGPFAALLFGLATIFLFAFQSCALPAAPADRYAIVIGIAAYPAYPLKYPVDDANDMATLLRSTGWTVDSADVLLDSVATRSAIQTAIAAFTSKVGSNSSILVYYSGHGAISSDDKTAYMIPYDGIISPDGYDMTKWITAADIDGWLNAIPCSNRILILDSCYSGGFVDTSASTDAAPANYGPNDGGVTKGSISIALADASGLLAKAFSDSSDPSILTISAAGMLEPSYDDEGHLHGAFTYWLLQAGSDSSADRDGNKLVTATEAYAYAKDKLLTNWDVLFSSTPTSVTDSSGNPIYADFLPRISGGSGDIVLYDNR
ncbi:MAG TPA: caspase family protein [Rectinemataceae bacterium]|nr:caspase family protein [Rectinemataceae bacterium]